MAMYLTANPNRCQGHARCLATAPEVITLNEEGYNRMQHVEIATDDLGKAFAAGEACPERAISIEGTMED